MSRVWINTKSLLNIRFTNINSGLQHFFNKSYSNVISSIILIRFAAPSTLNEIITDDEDSETTTSESDTESSTEEDTDSDSSDTDSSSESSSSDDYENNQNNSNNNISD